MRKLVTTLGIIATLAIALSVFGAWRTDAVKATSDDVEAQQVARQDCTSRSVLAYKNRFQNMKLPLNLNKQLSTVDISCFHKIRITARLHADSLPSKLHLHLTFADDNGVSVPLDTLDLKANTDGVTRVYEVIGMNLNLTLEAEKVLSIQGLDISIYGQR